jgi:glycosyltransferase involved in cell wall biosynthesis
LLWELIRARFGAAPVVCLHSQALGYQAALLFKGPRGRKRLVYQNPDYYCPITYPWRSRLEGIMARSCDLHINGEYHRGYIFRAQHGVRAPILISPPNLSIGFPVARPDAEIRKQLAGGAQGDEFLLRLHGGLHPLRRVSELFEALALLPRRFRLVMTREGDPARDQALDGRLAEAGILDRVVRLPRMEYCEVLRYTVSCDAGVLLYANNDLGNFFQSPGRLTEYLACGLPILSSHFTGLEALVRRYDIGECADALNPRDIVRAILRLESRARAGAFAGGRIRRVFETRFATELWGPRVVAAFEKLISGEARAEQAPPPEYWWPGDGEGPGAGDVEAV